MTTFVSHEHHHFRFDAAIPPRATVEPGARLTVRTLDCFGNAITSSAQRFETDAALAAAVPGLNPVTGPIAVRGARPGDRLVVRVERIVLGTLGAHAVTIVVPGSGGPTGASDAIRSVPADTRIFPLENGRVTMQTCRGKLALPLRPMIGSIGTAADEPFASLESHPACGGNMDCPAVTAGSTLTLPVRTPGALLSLGDVHAAMGDAEVTATALETSADVTFTVDLDPANGSPLQVPRVDTAASIGSIGCGFGRSLEANLEAAFADVVERLRCEYGLSPAEAYELAGAAARVGVNQCVPGGWAAVHAWIARTCLPRPVASPPRR